MADDKKKDGDGEEQGGKRKGLPALVLVAAGALAGGAGVVVAVPPQKVEVPVVAPPPGFVFLEHPDVMEFQFNPRTQAGKAWASASFYFVYRVREDLEEAAFESIRAHWNRAHSHILLLLGSRTVAELNAENGKRVLASDIVDELDATLFPGRGEAKVARVTEILWNKLIFQ